MPITLRSERLRLTALHENDLDNVHRLHSIPEVDAYNTLGIPEDLEATKRIVESWLQDLEVAPIQNLTLAITLNGTDTFIGLFGMKLGSRKFGRAEVWYKLLPEFWCKGYATEALRSMIAYGFDTLDLHRIEAGCAVENIGSIKVLEKVGMTREGRCRKILPLKTGWADNFSFAILDSDPRP
ncbi:MAG: GNAT family N-acetyltransferase [Flavobacteriaceae bacterium]|nr:GNAT family N-acetyltransferase [Flavobacteriaceae bacterium]